MSVEFATLGELKSALAGTGGVVQKTINDARMQGLLDEHAGILVDQTNRSFDPNPPLDDDGRDTADDVTLTFHVRNRRVVPIPDARVVTSVTLDGAVLSDFHYEPLTQNGVVIAVIPRYVGRVLTVVGRFGIWPIPDSVKGAVIEMAARAYKSQDARFGDVVVMQDGGSVSYYKTLPPRAQLTINNFKLPLIA